jgi:hypothetical protein
MAQPSRLCDRAHPTGPELTERTSLCIRPNTLAFRFGRPRSQGGGGATWATGEGVRLSRCCTAGTAVPSHRASNRLLVLSDAGRGRGFAPVSTPDPTKVAIPSARSTPGECGAIVVPRERRSLPRKGHRHERRRSGRADDAGAVRRDGSRRRGRDADALPACPGVLGIGPDAASAAGPRDALVVRHGWW